MHTHLSEELQIAEDLWEDGRAVDIGDRAWPRLGVQRLEYSGVRKRRRQEGSGARTACLGRQETWLQEAMAALLPSLGCCVCGRLSPARVRGPQVTPEASREPCSRGPEQRTLLQCLACSGEDSQLVPILAMGPRNVTRRTAP